MKLMRDAQLSSIEWHKQKHKNKKLLGLSTSETPLSEIPESILFYSAISSPNSALGSPMDPDSEFVEGSCPHFPRSENPNSDLGFLCDSEPLQPDSDLEFPNCELAFPDSDHLFPESDETFQDSEAAMEFGEAKMGMDSEPPVEADDDAGVGDKMMRLLFPHFFDPNYAQSEAAMALGETTMGTDYELPVAADDDAGVGDEMMWILLPLYFELVRPFLLSL